MWAKAKAKEKKKKKLGCDFDNAGRDIGFCLMRTIQCTRSTSI